MALSSSSTIEQVKEHLLARGISEETAERFSSNGICGLAFFSLTEDDLKELVPLIGARIKVRGIIKDIKEVSSITVVYEVHYYCFVYYL